MYDCNLVIEKHEGSVRESADAGAIGRTSLLLARAHKGESNMKCVPVNESHGVEKSSRC
jgi:hypothetical protein